MSEEKKGHVIRNIIIAVIVLAIIITAIALYVIEGQQREYERVLIENSSYRANRTCKFVSRNKTKVGDKIYVTAIYQVNTYSRYMTTSLVAVKYIEENKEKQSRSVDVIYDKEY